jgi:hypothetical protein
LKINRADGGEDKGSVVQFGDGNFAAGTDRSFVITRSFYERNFRCSPCFNAYNNRVSACADNCWVNVFSL